MYKGDPLWQWYSQQAWGWPLGRPGGSLHRLVWGNFHHYPTSSTLLKMLAELYIFIINWLCFKKVLLVSTCIVLSCLKRETKKFEKRLSRIGKHHHQDPYHHHHHHHQDENPGKERENQVGDLARLDSLTARYVQLTLTQVCSFFYNLYQYMTNYLSRLPSVQYQFVCYQGALQRLAGALSREPQGGELEIVRGQASFPSRNTFHQWYHEKLIFSGITFTFTNFTFT